VIFLVLLFLLLAGCTDPAKRVRALDKEIEVVRRNLAEAETARVAVRGEKRPRDALRYEIRQLEAELATLKKRR
jgi:hypothetical protein